MNTGQFPYAKIVASVPTCACATPLSRTCQVAPVRRSVTYVHVLSGTAAAVVRRVRPFVQTVSWPPTSRSSSQPKLAGSSASMRVWNSVFRVRNTQSDTVKSPPDSPGLGMLT